MSFFIIFLLLFTVTLKADNVMNLLNEIEKTEDLSLKTKQESAGISYVITRYQLDMMQAKYLRDVLKNTVVGYEISRYGVLDPWSANNLPYASNGIRIFIDNQEITTGKYDNGLFLFGNLDLSFIDHIEIYYLTPTYKISTEPAYVIIKLYSKDPKRDDGNRISNTFSSYASNSQTITTADSEKNYFIHFSRSEVNHKKIIIDGTPISRDTLDYHFFTTFEFKDIKFLINSIYQNQKPFMGVSLDGKLDNGYEIYKTLHLGAEKNINGWNVKYMLDYMKDETNFYEKNGLFFQKINTAPFIVPVTSIYTDGFDMVNTLKIDKATKINSHKFIYGIDLRNKHMDYNRILINGNPTYFNGMKKQNVFTSFLEDNILIKKNLMFTLGYEFSKYVNDKIKNYNLHQYKFSGVYLADKKNIFKFSVQHIEYGVPPYIYKTFYGGDNDLKPQKSDLLIAKYKKFFDKNTDIELVAFTGKNENMPIMQKDGTLSSSTKNIFMNSADLKFHKNYNAINDLIIEYIYIKLKNLPLNRSHKIFVLNTHRIGKFDLFENLIYKNNEFKVSGQKSKKDGFDLSLGIKYNFNDNLTISLKGENLFNSAYENSFYRVILPSFTVDRVSTQLIERRITFGMEYWF